MFTHAINITKRLLAVFGVEVFPYGKYGPQAYLDSEEFKYILWIDRLYQKIEHVPGNIVEIGVAHGRNAVIFGHMIRMNGEENVRHYYGFDTFDGYTDRDLRADRQLKPGAWKNVDYKIVKDRISRLGLGATCTLVKGDVRETAQAFVDSGNVNFRSGRLLIAMLYIDCNVYDPAIFSIEFFENYMAPGGIICIDEKLQGGETKAILDFAKVRGLAVVRDSGPFSVPAYVKIPSP